MYPEFLGVLLSGRALSSPSVLFLAFLSGFLGRPNRLQLFCGVCTVAPALNIKSISPSVIPRISYIRISGKNGHCIELNKGTIPIFSKFIFVEVISAQTLYIPRLKADV